MTTIHKFWKNKSLEISTAAILIVAGILAVLGRESAFYNSMTDILLFCNEASRIIVGSLMFPLVAIVICASVKEVRKKLLSVVCAKLIMEIMFIPFGINLNFFSDVLISDLSGLFFIAADFILLISIVNEKVEKAMCGGVLSAVSVISLFTVAISSRNGDATIYICRTLSTVLFYVSVFYGSFKLPVVKAHTGIRAELKYRVKKEKEKAKLVTLLFFSAVCACTTTFFVVMSSKNIYVPNEKTVELICYISWCALFLFVSQLIASHINNFTTAKSIVTAFCVAAVSTLQVVILNSYGHLLEYNYWFGDEFKLSYYNFFVSDITYTYSFGWLRYPAVFLTVFLVSLIVFIIISKRQNDDIRRIIGKIKASVYADDEEFNDFGDDTLELDFGGKTAPDNDWGSVFDGDTFAMDNKIYDVLLTFENEAETEKFIVYTDNSLDEDGKVQIFASKYMPEISVDKLIPIEDDEEWATIKRLLDYAMERVSQNTEKGREGIESKKESRNNKQGEFDAFTTLCYMAKAIVQNEKNKVPFILTTKGEDENNDAYGVTMSGTAKELETLLKYTMMGIAKRYKSDGIRSSGVYDRFSEITVSAVGEVYKSKLREEIERMMSENKDDFDVNNYLEGD